MIGLIIFVCVFALILILKINPLSANDPFRYVWNLDFLEKKYYEFQPVASEVIKKFYEMARLRIVEGKRKEAHFSKGFFQEVEYVMRTRRSLDVLLTRTWGFAKELASFYGYNEDEISKGNFFCPGWNELWGLYHTHKERILSKNYSQEKTREKKQSYSKTSNNDSKSESSYEHHYGEQRTHKQKASTSNAKSRNEQIFQGITNLKELKKKYFRLAKLNHPDHGGSEEAMKLLNQYYQEAIDRILASEGIFTSF